MRIQAAKALEALGFSGIESLVYCFLLENSPATGYRVSQAIGKPTANTYNAIAALAQRGAIVVDDSATRLCRAVPPGELLDRLNREFEAKRQQADAELAKLRPASGDDRVYQLTSIEQVLERARAMLAAARRVALLDLFPRALSLLERDLGAAAKRGVKVGVRAYSPAQIKGVQIVVPNESAHILSTWPGEHMSIAVDADQFMIALLTKDAQTVHQAIWSNSTILACLQYNALQVELMLTEEGGNGHKRESGLQAWSLTRLKPPGFLKLNERYGEAIGRRRTAAQ